MITYEKYTLVLATNKMTAFLFIKFYNIIIIDKHLYFILQLVILVQLIIFNVLMVTVYLNIGNVMGIMIVQIIQMK